MVKEQMLGAWKITVRDLNKMAKVMMEMKERNTRVSLSGALIEGDAKHGLILHKVTSAVKNMPHS